MASIRLSRMHACNAMIAALAAFLWSLNVAAYSLEAIEDFGENPGNLSMLAYFPASLSDRAALVVIPHGCFQTVDYLAEHSGWIELADRYGFAILFPETNKANEPFGACFRTWVPQHQARGVGEPRSLQQMIHWLLENRNLDPARVYIAGMSSGGLMASVMLATYPELFAAGAVQSAYPYKCATAFEELQPCSQAQKDLNEEILVQLLISGYPEYAGPRPPVSLWHGANDTLLVPANLDLQLIQWAGALDADPEEYELTMVDGHQRKQYRDSNDRLVLETWLLDGTSHAIAVSPGNSSPCGKVGDYFEDSGICAAFWIADWFGLSD